MALEEKQHAPSARNGQDADHAAQTTERHSSSGDQTKLSSATVFLHNMLCLLAGFATRATTCRYPLCRSLTRRRFAQGNLQLRSRNKFSPLTITATTGALSSRHQRDQPRTSEMTQSLLTTSVRRISHKTEYSMSTTTDTVLNSTRHLHRLRFDRASQDIKLVRLHCAAGLQHKLHDLTNRLNELELVVGGILTVNKEREEERELAAESEAAPAILEVESEAPPVDGEAVAQRTEDDMRREAEAAIASTEAAIAARQGGETAADVVEAEPEAAPEDDAATEAVTEAPPPEFELEPDVVSALC